MDAENREVVEKTRAVEQIKPSVKARLLYVAPKSLKLDYRFFSHPGNILSLLKFLQRTNLIDVSLKVLSVYYAHLTKNENLSGKVVYNQLARVWM